jgi:SAM-dependent methyltransferase
MPSDILRRLRQHVVSTLRQDYVIHQQVVLPPPGLRKCDADYRDDSYFLQSAQREADRVIQRCGVTGHSCVLEVGCGPGRFPIGLLSRLGELAQYWGMDVQARSIQWCQRYLTRAHPTVQFRHLNVHNLRYNPSGEPLDANFRFPFPERSFDLIYLYSVFSHMISADIRVYLHDFQRLLVRTGWVCFTGFLEEGVPEMMSNPPGYRPRFRGPCTESDIAKPFSRPCCTRRAWPSSGLSMPPNQMDRAWSMRCANRSSAGNRADGCCAHRIGGGWVTPAVAKMLVEVTGRTTSFAPGDDGAIQSGVPFPKKRFLDQGSGTVVGKLTGPDLAQGCQR